MRYKFIFRLIFLTAVALKTANADTTYVFPGNVSGTWTTEGSPYIIVMGDAIIPLLDTLFIESGVKIMSGTFIRLIVNGSLQAIGAEEDSITFTNSIYGPGWRHIEFHQNNSSSLMEYCIIENGNSLEPTGYGSGGGAWNIGANVTFKHCMFRDNYAISGGAVCLSGFSITTFDSCGFYSNQVEYAGGAINSWGMGTIVIRNCEFLSNYSYNYGAVMYAYGDSITIENSSFRYNSSQYSLGIIIAYGYEILVRNCSLYANWNNQGIYTSCNTIRILNNIFDNINGDEAIYISGTVDSIDINHNCFNGYEPIIHTYNQTPPGFEQLTTVNVNGDSCDIYGNLFRPPLYVDPQNGNLNLQLSSPCIDAGNPDLPFDPDNTIADMGRYFFDQTLYPIENLTIILQDENAHLNWPSNPLSTQYCVYKSSVPYFELSTAQHFFTADTFFVDSDALSEGTGFYRVTVIRNDE